MYDMIGDVHGYAQELKALLKELGYQPNAEGAWAHPTRSAIFVGDLIDRGPDQVEVVSLVKAMCEAGSARVVMGNHELNTIAYSTPHPERKGEFLRAHSGHKITQHAAYLEQVGGFGSALHQAHIAWFKTLPLWIEEEGLRVIHACWHLPSMALIEPLLTPDKRLSDELLSDPHFGGLFNKTTARFKALEVLLKGLELDLPQGVSFTTKDGAVRTETRVRWWLKDPKTWCELAQINDPPEALRGLPLSEELIRGHYQDELESPVFCGHYWMRGQPTILSDRCVCTDWSVAKERGTHRRLAAYRWAPHEPLSDERWVWVERFTPDQP